MSPELRTRRVARRVWRKDRRNAFSVANPRRTGGSDGFSERVRRSLQAVTDFGQFSRREINALLLDIRALLLAVCALLLAVSALANLVDLLRHSLHGPSEIGQLTSDARYVLFGCHVPVADSTRLAAWHALAREPETAEQASQDRRGVRRVQDRECGASQAVLVLDPPELALD